MKSLPGTLRISALALLFVLLFAGGESQSADRFPSFSSVTAVTPAESTPASKQAGGGALVLGAYGFLLMLRRRNLR